MRLKIERLIWRGRSLARLDSGKVVIFDPGPLPGELHEAEIYQEKKDFVRARSQKCLVPHPKRRKHPCIHFKDCGGCVFGALPVSEQVGFKKDLLKQELRRNLSSRIQDPVLENIRFCKSKPSWRYRWRGQVLVQKGKPHLRQMLSNELVKLNDCLLFSRPLINGVLCLSQALPEGKQTIVASPVDFQAVSAWSGKKIKLPVFSFYHPLELSPGVFFQANQKLNSYLIEYVLSRLKGCLRVADLYAGAGNFALPLCRQSEKVLALEGGKEAVDDLQAYALSQGIDNLELGIQNLRSSKGLNRVKEFSPDGLVLDPPRSGAGKGLRGLARIEGLKRILWVSCDIVNTCRDLAYFLDLGWEVEEVLPLDMFPQTWHLEAVFSLGKR